ncbi:GTP-binding protein [Paraburkholderia sp. LEh10]|uniref:GTP-binding protein n=1 Tax=Paraburkholderia sp. LEh10 TaxID=2821353 RepID=UPI001AE61589|nr:GTP-binding protein [Paraburkholderia sp. LEh10]MBP0591121.1 GTP-binding protein [Paraburkholderia sp. LEh10]
MNQPLLPVTVISGFLGAGKTALVDQILSNRAGPRIAAIVPDLAAVRLDIDNAAPVTTGASRVELPNGCACVEADEDVLEQMLELASANRFDAIVIEAAAVDEPLRIVESIIDDGSLAERASIDTAVTVIDAANFMRDYASTDALSERGIATHDDDDRTIVEVLIEQVEFADMLVINKADLVSPDDLIHLQAILAALNPRAVQIVSSYGNAPIEEVVRTARFDYDATSNGAGWLALLHDPISHEDKADEHAEQPGVGHFVYRARRPFHPERLWALLHEEWKGVLRGKGFFWLATRNDIGGSLSQAGGACRPAPAGTWWAAQDRSEWPEGDAELMDEIAADWYGDMDDFTIGDRRQELVLIGVDLDRSQWRAKFDACLLTDDEYALGAEGWRTLADPFPAWDLEDDDHDHAHHHDHDHDDDGHHHHRH